MSVRRMMAMVALISLAMAGAVHAARHCVTAFETGKRGYATPGYYAEFDVGCCRLVYLNTAYHGRRVEFQPAWSGAVVLWRGTGG
jgi:hypothetical protein